MIFGTWKHSHRNGLFFREPLFIKMDFIYTLNEGKFRFVFIALHSWIPVHNWKEFLFRFCSAVKILFHEIRTFRALTNFHFIRTIYNRFSHQLLNQKWLRNNERIWNVECNQWKGPVNWFWLKKKTYTYRRAPVFTSHNREQSTEYRVYWTNTQKHLYCVTLHCR